MRATLIVLLVSSLGPVGLLKGGCDEIYRIAVSQAQVKSVNDLKIRTSEYIKSDKFQKSSDKKNLDIGGSYGVISGYLGWSSDERSNAKALYEKATVGDMDQLMILYFVEKEYGLPLLKLYNDCLKGTDSVSAAFTFTPGAKEGAVTVKTVASGLQSTIKSVHRSGLTLRENNPLQPGAKIDFAGLVADFDVDPTSEIAWILVQTEAGGAMAILGTKVPPTPTPISTVGADAPIRSKRVTVPAKTAQWLDSGVALNEGEVARITVDPAHGEWTVQGNKPSSFRGLGSLGGDEYAVGGRAAGALVVKDGDVKTYGFDRGVDELWIRTPGRIAFVCNDIRERPAVNATIFKIPRFSGFDDNAGDVVAIIDVFAAKKGSD